MFASITSGTLVSEPPSLFLYTMIEIKPEPFLQFALAWWVVIDSNAEYAEPVYAAFYICGILSTIALLM